MKRLLILRHAKSSWDDSSLPDWQRPLNDRGERDAPRVGELLRDQSLIPDLIITSDAVRARTTAEAAAQGCGYRGEVTVEPSLYHASPADVIDVVRQAPDTARTVLVVGHNPCLENLVEQLTGESLRMPTAALVHVSVPIDRWRDLNRNSGATIASHWRPADFPD